MVKLNNFVSGVNVLREYVEWEQKMYDLGIDLQETKVADLFNELLNQIQDGNDKYGWDEVTEKNWILEWCYNVRYSTIFKRLNIEYNISNAEQLYYFINDLNKEG